MKRKEAIVYKSTGSWYKVRTKDGEWLDCRVKGRFRLEGKKLTNPVAVGDRVQIEFTKGGDTNIVKIENRTNYLVRQSPRKKHFLHLLGSNLDQALLVVTWKEPGLKIGFIDRYLLMSQIHDVPTIIIFNKSDLLTEQDLDELSYFASYYVSIGYPVMLTSAITGDGIDQLKEVLKNKTSFISGHSGVGKSTLINAIQPGIGLKTTELSNYTGKGQHTTTFAEMFVLDFGGRLIDNPGIKLLSFNHMEKMDIAHNFREFFERSPGCKFNDCLHIDEPKCAVLDAVAEGEITMRRYENYLVLMEEVDNQNYWEINKDF